MTESTGIRYAEKYTDADPGDMVMAAVDDLPDAGGTVVLPYGEVDYSSPITITKNGIRLKGHGYPSRYPRDGVPGTLLNFQGTTTNGLTLGDVIKRTNGLCLEKFMLACPRLTTGKAIAANRRVTQAYIRDIYLMGRKLSTVAGFSDNGDGKTLVYAYKHGMADGETVVFSVYCSRYQNNWIVEQATEKTFVIDAPFAGSEYTWAYPKCGTGLDVDNCISWISQNVCIKGFRVGLATARGHHAAVYRDCYLSGNMVGARISGGAGILFSGGECSDYHRGDFIGFEVLDGGPVTISDVYSEIHGADSRFVVVGGRDDPRLKPNVVAIRDCYLNGHGADHAIEINRCHGFRLVGGTYGGPWGKSLVNNNAKSVSGITLKPAYYGWNDELVDDRTGIVEMRNAAGRTYLSGLCAGEG